MEQLNLFLSPEVSVLDLVTTKIDKLRKKVYLIKDLHEKEIENLEKELANLKNASSLY